MSRTPLLTEEDTKLRHITPAIEAAGWAKEQMLMEYFFTDGRVQVHGKTARRGKRKKADYLLTAPNRRLPLAIVEAKSRDKTLGDGMQQAIEYAEILDIPFAYTSNGTGFLEHNRLTGVERELALHEFPSYGELWARFSGESGLSDTQQTLLQSDYHFDTDKQTTPRYYQRIAIDRTVAAISGGQERVLLVMATGTGKTYTAFQIIWRLMQSGQKKRVLYLADRNILIDQTIQNDFRPLKNKITKVEHKKLDSSYEVYMSLYQQLAGDVGEEPFRQFKPEFFDLIVVDECHRGSARDESQWRRVLDYFKSATHLGLTATPKVSTEADNIHYFGEPVYTYSLKQGIEDGFLAPYKVIRVGIDKDLQGWRPPVGTTDTDGDLVEDRVYEREDFDRHLIIDERTAAVARRITRWLEENDPFAKTIVFCTDIDHAERMRHALVKENRERMKENPKYIMRITGDNPEGKAQLDNFIDPNERYPAVVTTSKLMTTGVDCKTCKLIVLDNEIKSMTEFKQIIGRGTRINDAYGKQYFTIMDFRNVTNLFADPEFDGEPVSVMDDSGDDAVIYDVPDGGRPSENGGEQADGGETGGDGFVPPEDEPKKKKVRVRGVDVTILNERVEILDENGRLITESLTDYSRRNILNQYATLDVFLQAWNDAEKKQAVLDALEDAGLSVEILQETYGKAEGIDPFDLILNIAYNRPAMTRKERARRLEKDGFLQAYSEECRAVLSALLDKYMNEGISLEQTAILQNAPFSEIGTPMKIVSLFGGKSEYERTIREVQRHLYHIPPEMLYQRGTGARLGR
ncbi:EcoAI/FtnUII family type I restriction enzme subunit R [Neisseria dumasiana]|uniref:Restriction endonuclease subunit R n=1 Tax=Neisseria dumasiana TaxID=1931275 RepID=A0A1X3DH13_9NEIS|nr:DEAD/DEAH box helicase family protein [Neisseria dumasiana]OSI19844.1 restriction endonuclease subunit R [Neisseria dumasiana]